MATHHCRLKMTLNSGGLVSRDWLGKIKSTWKGCQCQTEDGNSVTSWEFCLISGNYTRTMCGTSKLHSLVTVHVFPLLRKLYTQESNWSSTNIIYMPSCDWTSTDIQLTYMNTWVTAISNWQQNLQLKKWHVLAILAIKALIVISGGQWVCTCESVSGSQ